MRHIYNRAAFPRINISFQIGNTPVKNCLNEIGPPRFILFTEHTDIKAIKPHRFS